MPQEHAQATARYMEKQREIVVRDGLRPDMESILRLEKSGDLSLFTIRRRWGLETCSIIDPPEMKLGFAADPNRLPANVVKDLVEKHGCIKIIEPYASYETLIKRELRQVALACTSIFQSWSILARASAKDDYHAVRQRLSEPLYVSESYYIDWARAVNLGPSARGADLGLLRFGDAMVDTVAASTCLRFVFWVGLTVLFFAAPEEHAKALGLEDGKLMLVLSG
ncbi:hypothetical protein FB451DRAFT_1401476 [Mycena latifolia]|nr:hypothetical protein FB451DRAFT_1401476 [Mycena latifolia]